MDLKMKKNYGLRKDFFWEEVRPEASMNDYILIFDADNFYIFCENTNIKYTEIKQNLNK